MFKIFTLGSLRSHTHKQAVQSHKGFIVRLFVLIQHTCFNINKHVSMNNNEEEGLCKISVAEEEARNTFHSLCIATRLLLKKNAIL